MYEVLDIPKMVRIAGHIRQRKKPIAGFKSTLLLRPGTDLGYIPPNSELRLVSGYWECHTQLSNKKILKKLAESLDAVAFLCYK